ncbi:universal stress protein [Hephaestia mangrovi]|uniref:universal stress protein n=1 Tax=Hephaestia mangrovi TaxID=2873268 RepID=UPI001CA74C28|nr:universal stress protein [Hephaestia mangrovi]MBY8829345.1 universal stress protein [Hephaestia mangrovi]
MKNILLLVHDDPGQEARLQAALDVTRALEGHLTCLDVVVMPPVMGMDVIETGATSMLLADERERESANRARLEQRLAHEDVPWNWHDVVGNFEPALRSAADLADLIVVSRQLEDFPLPDMRHVAGDLVVKSGKPVLAVPDYAEGLAVAETALVAWDGSHTAAAALRAAVPLLQLAGKVVVLQFSEPDNDALVEDAAIYLSRHGVHAVIRRERPEGKIGDALIAEAASGRYAYVVMGGFGHLRFVEGLFGGVTRTMLTKSPIPVFLAH